MRLARGQQLILLSSDAEVPTLPAKTLPLSRSRSLKRDIVGTHQTFVFYSLLDVRDGFARDCPHRHPVLPMLALRDRSRAAPSFFCGCRAISTVAGAVGLEFLIRPPLATEPGPAVRYPPYVVEVRPGYRVSAHDGERRVALQGRVAPCRVVVGWSRRASAADPAHSRTTLFREAQLGMTQVLIRDIPG